MWWSFSQQSFAKAWFLPCLTVCTHQARIVIYENSKIFLLNFTAMELSSDVLCLFLVWGLRSDGETVIGNRRLHLLESSGTSFVACLSFCRLEEMKLWSVTLCTQAWHARSDDMSDLSISSQFQISDKMQFFRLRDLDIKVLHGKV